MIDLFLATLRANSVMLLFFILAIGYLIGKTKIGTFELGPITGVLFAGLIFGHFQFKASASLQSLGFSIFIFSVGLQAGPRFFAVMRQDGLKYFTLALMIGSTGIASALIASHVFGLDPGYAAGALAGGLTSSPTLAAAQQGVSTGAVSVPDGYTVEQVLGNISAGYAITYLFGLLGLIVIIDKLPRLVGIDLPAEAAILEKGDPESMVPDPLTPSDILVRAYQVEESRMLGMTLTELEHLMEDTAHIRKIKRDGSFIPLRPETVIRKGDLISVIALRERVKEVIPRIGHEVSDPELLDYSPEPSQLVIINRAVVGSTLGALRILQKYGCFVSHLSRSGQTLEAWPSLSLQKGDVLSVTGPADELDRLGELLGHSEREVIETDLVTFSLGISGGIFIGAITITIAGVTIGLGTPGGLLAAGIVIGFLRSIHPTFGRVPEAVRWIFMELGLLIFMAGVGVSAGRQILATLETAGLSIFVCGLIITVTPIFVGFIFGSKVLKLNPVLLMGAITGSLTSGAALSIVKNAARSDVPALGYTGAYAFANVILTIAGTIIAVM
jgi:putative transport protein